MTGLEPYEVYALRYATMQKRSSRDSFMFDEHETNWPIDYFVFAVVGKKRTWVVDTGFDKPMAEKRGRTFLECPGDLLKRLGIAHDRVEDVILTHLHYDHCGNHPLFPKARFHLQDKEMEFATGRCMCHKVMRIAFEVEDVTNMVRRVFDGRVAFHQGEEELAPGISVHHMPGHTMGIQCVRVWTRRGWLVLAADVAHFYRNMEEAKPFPIVWNVPEMLESHKRLYKLASDPACVIPGHDPEVLKRYPAAKPGLEGIAVRLDADPIA